MYFVYILECTDGTFYTGITTDIKKRFLAHKEKKGGRYTAAKGVRRIVYSEKSEDRSNASKREWAIKKMTRKEKEILINSV